MQRVISYHRFSSKKQEKGDSTRRQEELRDAYLKKHNLTLTESYEDLGISAFRLKNAQKGKLRGFLNLVEDGLIPVGTILIVEALDRLSRSEPMEALNIFSSIIRRGIIIVTTLDGSKYDNSDLDTGKILLMVMNLCKGHQESKDKSERLKKVWEAKRELAETQVIKQKLPLWLKRNKKTNELEEVKENVEAIKRMFELAEVGFGAFASARMLREESYKINNKNIEKRYITATLKNEAVFGNIELYNRKFYSQDEQIRLNKPESERVFQKKIEGYYPQIISKEQFDRVQMKVKQRRKKGIKATSKYVNIFHGILKSESGSTFTTRNRAGKGIKKTSIVEKLFVDNSKEQSGESNNFSFPARALELAVIDVLSNYEMPALQHSRNYRAEINEIEKEIGDKKIHIETLQQELAKIGKIKSVLPILSNLEKELEKLEDYKNTLLDSMPVDNYAEQFEKINGLHVSTDYSNALLIDEKRVWLQNIFRDTIESIIMRIEKNGFVAKAFCKMTLKNEDIIEFQVNNFVPFSYVVQVFNKNEISFIYADTNEEERQEIWKKKNLASARYIVSLYDIFHYNKNGLSIREIVEKTGFSKTGVTGALKKAIWLYS